MSVAVVFPGQGSQFPGMGKDFYDRFESVRGIFKKADEALGYGLSEIMFQGPEETLRLTQNAQPALVTMSAAIWELLREKVKPSFFAGHSLGEYSALYAAGGMTFEEAVKAVHNRGRFMQEAVPVGEGAMAAVLGMEDSEVAAECQAFSRPGAVTEPANFNSPGQVVIAGHAAAVAALSEILKEKGAKRVIPLSVSAPFHCSLMEPAKEAMKKYLERVSLEDLKTPVYNNVDAAEEREAEVVKEALIRQVTGAVRWSDSIKNMIKNGADVFIEAGPGSVLTGLIKKIDRTVTCLNVSSVDDLSKL